MTGKFYAAFMAAMCFIFCILFGGCGGEGGGFNTPRIPIFVQGKVVDEKSKALAGVIVRVSNKSGIRSFTTEADGRFRLNVTGQEGLLAIEARHPSVGTMQQLVDLSDAESVNGLKLLEILSPLVIRRNIREVHLEAGFVRVSGATKIEYDRLENPKPIELKLEQLIDGSPDLVIGYKYLAGDPRVDLGADYINYWYLYPSGQGRAIVSAVYDGPKPDKTRVFVTLDFVFPTDQTPPTIHVDPLTGTVSGFFKITGSAADVDGSSRLSEVETIKLSELIAGRSPMAVSRDYNGQHIEGKPTGIERIGLRYNQQVPWWILPRNDGSFVYTIDTRKLPNGLMIFELFANDFAGNLSEIVNVSTAIHN